MNLTRLVTALAAVVVLPSLGCGSRQPSDADRGPEIVLRLSLQPNPANKAWEASNLFREEIEKRSQGRVKVLLYDSGTLGDERQVIEACYLGVVEMVQFTSSKASSLDPTFNLLDMPYLFVNDQHHQRVLHGPIGQRILDGLRAHRLQGLAFYSCGFRNLFNTVGKEVRTPEDLQ